MNKTQSLTTGSIPGHVRNLALPSSIGMFFQTMYNVVDSFYAGQVSTTALAALALSFPVYLLIIAVSGGLSRGASALISNAIGAEDRQQQLRFTAQCLSMGFVVSILMTLLGMQLAAPLFGLLGATDDYLDMAMAYMTPIFLGAVFFVVSSLCNAILIASGDSLTFSKVQVAGFFANLILDPWFLYGGFGLPAMGIAGIAWATVLIQVASSIFMLSAVQRRGLINFDRISHWIPDLKTWGEIAYQAVPASFNIMSVALSFFVLTWFLKGFGESAVAAFGVTTRIEQIGLLPTFGLYAAIMALVGQNNGARNFDRVRETMRVGNRVGLTLVLTTSTLIFLMARPLLRIFTDDPEVIQIGVRYIHIITFVQWSYVMTSTHLAFLQAIKRPMYGFFQAILRKILLPLPLIYLLVIRWEYGIDAVWFSMAGTNVLMTLVTIVYAQRVLKNLTQSHESDSTHSTHST